MTLSGDVRSRSSHGKLLRLHGEREARLGLLRMDRRHPQRRDTRGRRYVSCYSLPAIPRQQEPVESGDDEPVGCGRRARVRPPACANDWASSREIRKEDREKTDIAE